MKAWDKFLIIRKTEDVDAATLAKFGWKVLIDLKMFGLK